MAIVLFERPGLGIGLFFYISIALLSGAVVRSSRGHACDVPVLARGHLNHDVPTYELFTVSTPIRLLTYVLIGALLGWFAQHYKTAVAELQVLAERDSLTAVAICEPDRAGG